MFPDFRSPKAYVSLILLIVMFIVPVVLGTPFWTNLFVLLFVSVSYTHLRAHET